MLWGKALFCSSEERLSCGTEGTAPPCKFQGFMESGSWGPAEHLQGLHSPHPVSLPVHVDRPSCAQPGHAGDAQGCPHCVLGTQQRWLCWLCQRWAAHGASGELSSRAHPQGVAVQSKPSLMKGHKSPVPAALSRSCSRCLSLQRQGHRDSALLRGGIWE